MSLSTLKRGLIICAMFMGAVLVVPTSYAATCTWTDANTNNSWNDNGNWSCGNIPTNVDDVVFDGTATTNCNMDQVGAVVNSISLNAGFTGTFQLQQNIGVGNGGITLNAGTFNGGNVQLQTTGNLARTAGTVDLSNTTVVFNGNSNQTASMFNTTNVGNVTVNNSGGAGNNQVIATGIVTVLGNITLQAGNLDMATNNVALVAQGNIDASGGGGLLPGSLVQFSGTPNQLVDNVGTFNDISISNVGGNTITFQNVATLDINGNLQTTNGTLDLSTNNVNVTIAGNWDTSGGGSVTAGPTVTLDGTSQSILGGNTFNNLTKSVGAADTLTMQSSQTQVVNGTLTLNGAAGQLLTLVPSSVGVNWPINPTSTRVVQFVDVTRSQNLNLSAIDCAGCTDSGNNVNWTFSAVPPAETTEGRGGGGKASRQRRFRNLRDQAEQLGLDWWNKTVYELNDMIQDYFKNTIGYIDDAGNPVEADSGSDTDALDLDSDDDEVITEEHEDITNVPVESVPVEVDLDDYADPDSDADTIVPTFRDLLDNQWYTDPMQEAVDTCILKGDDNANTIRPGDPVNFFEFNQILSNATHPVYEPPAVTLYDDQWWAQAIWAGVTNNWWNRVPLDLTIETDESGSINEGEFAQEADFAKKLIEEFSVGPQSFGRGIFMGPVAQAFDLTYTYDPVVENIFDNLTDYGYGDGNVPEVKALIQHNVIRPQNNQINPNRTPNRAEVATVIQRAAEASGTPLFCGGVLEDTKPNSVNITKVPCPYNQKTIVITQIGIKQTKAGLYQQMSKIGSPSSRAELQKQVDALTRIENSLERFKNECDLEALSQILGEYSAILNRVGEKETATKVGQTAALMGNHVPGGASLTGLQAEVDKLLNQELKHDTDCEEYNRLAAKLGAQQAVAAAALTTATKALKKAESDAKTAQDSIDGLNDSIKDANKELSKLNDALESLENDRQKILDQIVKNTNAATDGGAKTGNDHKALPSGFSVGVGGNNPGFPTAHGALYLRDGAAVQEFLKQRAKFDKEISNFNQAIKEQNQKIDDKVQQIADLNGAKAKANAALAAAKAAAAAAAQQQTAAEAAIDALNDAINKLNAAYAECPKKVAALKAAKAKADAAIDAAEDGKADAEDADYDDPTAQGMKKDADGKLDAANAANARGDHERAEELAGEAQQGYSNAAAAQKAADCIKECEAALEKKQAELKAAKADQRNSTLGTRFDAAENTLWQADNEIVDAKNALRSGNSAKAMAHCKKAKALLDQVTGQIDKAIRDREQDIKDHLDRAGDDARTNRDDVDLGDVKEVVDDVVKALEDAIAAFENTAEAADLLKKLLELAEKYGIKIKNGATLKEALSAFGAAMEGAAEATGEAKAQAEKLQKELNEILEKTLFKYLRDKLGEKLTDAAAKLAASRLGGWLAGPLGAVFSEAWAIGSALGDAMVDKLLEARDDLFKNHTNAAQLCSDPNSQPAFAINRKIETYVEIIVKGNPDRTVTNKGGYAEMTYNDGKDGQGKRGEAKVKVPSGTAVATGPKMATTLPTGTPANEKVYVDGQQKTIIEKVVSVSRECTKDGDGSACLLIKMNVRYYVK